jgi:hypothetical protein
VANGNRQKSEAYNELLNTWKQVEPNGTRDTVVRKMNSMRSAFRKELKKWKTQNDWMPQQIMFTADNTNVYEPSLWYFNERLFLEDQDKADLPCMRQTKLCLKNAQFVHNVWRQQRHTAQFSLFSTV